MHQACRTLFVVCFVAYESKRSPTILLPFGKAPKVTGKCIKVSKAIQRESLRLIIWTIYII